MKLELYERYIQLCIDNDSYYSNKARRFADKHFSKLIKLSSSLLIISGEAEQYKKQYFINWAYHLSTFREDEESKKLHDKIMANLHLPIRIKFIDKRAIVDHVKVKMKFIAEDRISLSLSKHNRVAKRYLLASFREHIIGQSGLELFLSSDSFDFWEKFMGGLRQKVIFNVSIHFEYDKWDASNTFSGFDTPSYLTKEEKRVRRSLALLQCNPNDSFEGVKTRYLRLAKEYHPDNVYGQEKRIVESYTERFRAIQEAYEVVKRAYTKAA